MKMDIQALLIVASGLTAIILGLNAHWEAKKSENTSNANQQKVIKAQDSLIAKQDELVNLQRRYSEEMKIKTDSITQLQEELVKKSEALQYAQQEGMNLVSGGTSFCRVYLSNFSHGGFLILLVHEGQYPVYDIKLRAIDVNAQNEKNSMQYVDVMSVTKIYEVGTLGVGQTQLIDGPAMKGALTERKYNFFFTARNGAWAQQYILRLKGNKMFTATKVYKPESGKILHEHVQKGFLEANENEVPWEKEATGSYSLGDKDGTPRAKPE